MFVRRIKFQPWEPGPGAGNAQGGINLIITIVFGYKPKSIKKGFLVRQCLLNCVI